MSEEKIVSAATYIELNITGLQGKLLVPEKEARKLLKELAETFEAIDAEGKVP